MASIEKMTVEETVDVVEATVETISSLPSYERFKNMSPEEKADIWGFKQMQSFDTVYNLVSLYFYDIDHVADGNEIMEEAQQVYKGMRRNFIKQRTEEILEAINSMEYSYLALTDKEKAELFQFVPDDNNYNLELHMAVLKACGLKLDFDEGALEAIAEKAMEKEIGARALRAIIEEFMLDIMYEIPKDDNIGKVTITREYIEGTGGPVIDIRNMGGALPDHLN